MSVVSCSTTTTTAYKVTADTTGTLVLQTGATPTTAVTVGTDQSVTMAGTLATSSRGITKASMPSGSVLQVVQSSYSTQVSTASVTYTDTGLTATITPSSATSKVLVLISCQGAGKDTSNTWARLQFLRGATVLGVMDTYIGANASLLSNFVGSVCTDYLDSPATTSATTYKVQISAGNGGNAYINASGTEKSSITLMEIAA